MPGAEHRRTPWAPDLDAPLDLEGLVDPLFGDSRRLEEDADLAQALRQRDDVLAVLDIALREIAVQQVDPALVVDVVRREVLETDLVVERGARSANGRDDEAAGLDRVRDVRPHLQHAPEVLMARDEEVVAGRRCAVAPLVDLLVGPVDADAEHLHEHPSAVRHVCDRRLRNVGEVDRARLARDAPRSPSRPRQSRKKGRVTVEAWSVPLSSRRSYSS